MHPNNSLLQIQTKGPKVHKYQIRIPNTNCAQTKERATKQIHCNALRESKSPNRRTKTKWQQTSLTILYCNPQISKNQTKRKPIFLTHTKLCKFAATHSIYIGYSSQQRCKSTIEFVMQFPCVHVHHTNLSKRQSLLQV